MLRISVAEDGESLALVLEGRLVGPWVAELRSVWQERAVARGSRKLVVDLCGVTAMDTNAQALLEELLRDGAELRCGDVMNQYLVEQLDSSGGRALEACRPCQRFSHQSVSAASAAGSETSSTPSSDAA
jgi:hypothetical protein